MTVHNEIAQGLYELLQQTTLVIPGLSVEVTEVMALP